MGYTQRDVSNKVVSAECRYKVGVSNKLATQGIFSEYVLLWPGRPTQGWLSDYCLIPFSLSLQ